MTVSISNVQKCKNKNFTWEKNNYIMIFSIVPKKYNNLEEKYNNLEEKYNNLEEKYYNL